MLNKVIQFAESLKQYLTVFNAFLKAYDVFVYELKNPSFAVKKEEKTIFVKGDTDEEL